MFTQDFEQFYKELAANNNRDWFHANKKRYEQTVKIPFEKFVAAVIEEIKKTEPGLAITPKDCIFRIHRDVRFAKDKTPYKLHSSAVITKGGKKDYNSPGIYLELGPEDVRVYGGIYNADKLQLLKIRQFIAGNLKELDRILDNKDFQSVYGSICGEKNKIIDKSLKEAAAKQPLIYNKSFYYFTKMKPNVLLKKNFIPIVMDKYEIGRPMQDFLRRAIA